MAGLRRGELDRIRRLVSVLARRRAASVAMDGDTANVRTCDALRITEEYCRANI
jgi:hypothetical protein